MKEKKGFTLLELLAVILVLAIISLITTPIVLNVVEKSKEHARELSIRGYAEALNDKRTEELFKGNTVNDDDLTGLEVETKGSKVTCGVAKFNGDEGITLNGCLIENDNENVYCLINDEVLKNDDCNYVSNPIVDTDTFVDVVIPEPDPDCQEDCDPKPQEIIVVPIPEPSDDDDFGSEGGSTGGSSGSESGSTGESSGNEGSSSSGSSSSSKKNPEIMVYSVGYVSSYNATTIKYKINITNATVDLEKYELKLLTSDIMKTQKDYTNYKKMKDEAKTKTEAPEKDDGLTVIATAKEMYEHSLGSDFLTLKDIEISCDNTKCQATITVKIDEITNKQYHQVSTKNGSTVNALYVGVKFKLEVVGKSFASIIKNNNDIKLADEIDYSNISYYGNSFEEVTSSTTTTATFNSTRYYWFSNDYTFDEETGYYTVTGSDLAEKRYSSSVTQKYVCFNTNSSKKCTTLYELVSLDSSTAEVIEHKSKTLNYVTNGRGLYKETVGDSSTYFFRGNVVNNYVKFAGELWRIIRINEDGSVRLIYNGTIGSVAYNSTNTDNAYIGYMYGEESSTTYAEAHKNTNDSDIKAFIDEWYEENLFSYTKYLADTGFCSDRSLYSQNGYAPLSTSNFSDTTQTTLSDSGLGYGSNNTFYGAAYRMYYSEPSFSCINSNDLYTVSKANGNGALTYPIGLISADEVIYAGGSFATINRDYYLFLNESPWWTMSPQWWLTTEGYFRTSIIAGVDGLYYRDVKDGINVRPVINLKADSVYLKGNGTASNPYQIRMS